MLWCLVDLDVRDDEIGGIKALEVGVGLRVSKKAEEELGGLLWPSGSGNTELLS